MKYIAALTISATLSAINAKYAFLPNIHLVILLFAALTTDLITGVMKARLLGIARTSSGYRKTTRKGSQYVTFIVLSIIAKALTLAHPDWPVTKFILDFFSNGVICFLIFIEITSILENAYEMDKSSLASKFVFQPLLKLCTFQFKNNPIFKAAEEVAKDEK